MTDDSNKFNRMSDSFNELMKKYETISDTEPEIVLPEPAAPEEQPQEESFFTPDEVSFLFDDGLLGAESEQKPAEQPKPAEEKPQPEPKLTYDLNMFGGDESTEAPFKVDDSWLDESLDDSIFYRPDPVEEVIGKAEPVAAEPKKKPAAVKPEKFTVTVETETAEEPDFSSSPETNEKTKSAPIPEMTPVAGGFIVQNAVDKFTFDADSGIDFDLDEPNPEPELPVFTPQVPDETDTKKPKVKSKRKREKTETASMTGFDKEYRKDGKKKKKEGNFFTRNMIPKKGDSAGEVFRKLIMFIAVLAILGSAGYLFNDYVIVPYRTVKEIGELNQMIGNSNDVIDPNSLASKYPGITFPEGMLEKYAALYARNKDFVGWLSVDGLDISLPVVRGEDNAKYLKTDFDGKANKYGSLFMNCTNSIDTLNMNTTIFGHYMKDTKMFGNLMQYKTYAGYKKAPIIEFNTIYGDFKWKVFAVFLTNGESAGDNGYLFNYIFTDLKTEADLENFLGEIKVRSLYYPKVDIATSDKILTLSTCSYEFKEARLVVMARMVRPGEELSVDTSNSAIRPNSNPRYPQAYYDEKHLSNPYSTAARWYPS